MSKAREKTLVDFYSNVNSGIDRLRELKGRTDDLTSTDLEPGEYIPQLFGGNIYGRYDLNLKEA